MPSTRWTSAFPPGTAATNESFSVLGVFSQTSNNNNLLILSTGSVMW